jgi:IS30 family transposase
MENIINFISNIDNSTYNKIRHSKSDAECRRYLKEQLTKQLNLTDVVKRYRVEAISTINKKELYNEIFESKQKAEELYQVLLIKYYKTYTSVKMTEL